jgi:hypothetical protein
MPRPPDPAPRKFLMHYLIPDDAGPIESRRGGTAIPVGSDSRWRFACKGGEDAVMTEIQRGTTETYAVRCTACQGTERFKADYRPHPRMRRGDLVADGEPDEGCCG